jgi:hypothetical protein
MELNMRKQNIVTVYKGFENGEFELAINTVQFQHRITFWEEDKELFFELANCAKQYFKRKRKELEKELEQWGKLPVEFIPYGGNK